MYLIFLLLKEEVGQNPHSRTYLEYLSIAACRPEALYYFRSDVFIREKMLS